MPAPNIIVLRDLLQRVPPRLRSISNEAAETKPTPSAWSPKEELGHLLDSAANNHQRIVRAQFENGLAMPGYEQNRWVDVHGYQQREWSELIDTWQVFNRQLLAAAEAIPDAAWAHTLTVAASEPLTLQFVFDDYVDHMLHHLKHIGIEVNDLKSNASQLDKVGAA
ncbi:MAG TPA: DinB family protein [Terriglobales bacterium]|nr:DinB family protein [Terriglobales bacterium]